MTKTGDRACATPLFEEPGQEQNRAVLVTRWFALFLDTVRRITGKAKGDMMIVEYIDLQVRKHRY